MCHLGSLQDDIWLLVINCLEGGDISLKVSALTAISQLLDTCGLPGSVEVSSSPIVHLSLEESGWQVGTHQGMRQVRK